MPFLFLVAVYSPFLSSCSIFATRPAQEMSDTYAALRAAEEVQADTLAPELYHQARENYFRARREYKLKNFSGASDYASEAKDYAERAEIKAILGGATRVANESSDPYRARPIEEGSSQGDAGYERPQGTPVETDQDSSLPENQEQPQKSAPPPGGAEE